MNVIILVSLGYETWFIVGRKLAKEVDYIYCQNSIIFFLLLMWILKKKINIQQLNAKLENVFIF